MPKATPSQIIKIERLRAQIAKHVNEINRPYSTVISVAFPYVLTWLLLNEYSPLHSLYLEYYHDEQYALTLEKVERDVISGVSEMFVKRSELIKMIEDIVLTMREFIKLSLGESLSSEQMLDYLEKEAGVTIEIAPILEFRKALTQLASDYINILEEVGVKHHQINLDKLSLNELYDVVKTEEQITGKHFGKTIPIAKMIMAEAYVRSDFYNFMIIPKILFAVAGQKLLVDPILLRYFPSGIGQSRIPKEIISSNSERISSQDANQLIFKLKNREESLNKSARRNVNISRVMLPILIGLCFAYQGEIIEPELWFLLISALSCAVTGITVEISDLIKYWQYHRLLPKSEENCKQVFEGYSTKITTHEDDDLESTRIEIKLKHHKPLAVKKLRETIFKVLIKHNIDVSFVKSGTIVIPASELHSLTAEQIKAIRGDITSAIERTVAVQELEEQIQKLGRFSCIKTDIQHELDDFLESLAIYISIPTTLKNNFVEAFKSLDLEIDEESDQTTVIRMSGYTKSQSLFELEAEITLYQKAYAAKKKDAFTNQGTIDIPKKTTKIKTKKLKQKEEEKPQTQPRKEPQRQQKVEFPSATYDSDNPNNKVVPIENTLIGGKYRQFTLFRLTPSDFRTQEEHDKFKGIITEVPKIVPPKGNQGIVITNKAIQKHRGGSKSLLSLLFKDKKNKWQDTSAKAKALGNKGGTRVHATAEKAPTGETLHIFKVTL